MFSKKCLCVAGFFQSSALYTTIAHDPRSEYNRQESECSEHQQNWGVWGCSETSEEPLRKFLGAKEHLNWVKIDLNATKIITIQDYKHTQN